MSNTNTAEKISFESKELERIQFGRVLLNFARELGVAANTCLRLEEVISHLIEICPSDNRPAYMGEMQHLDQVIQHLVALSSLASSLAAQSTAGHHLNIDDAVGTLNLAQIAHRWRTSSGSEVSEETVPCSDPCDDVDFF